MVDLGYAPPSNAYLKVGELCRSETWYPLRVHVCPECWLVQTEDYADSDELFRDDYAYFSSTSQSWLAHAQEYCDQITGCLGLSSDSFVVELASNDGYLLRNFVAAGVPCLGIEPTAATAEQAESQGIPVLREFFGEALGKRLASEGRKADLVIGNNVYAHVPDINDFTAGIAAILAERGVVTLEFPHLLQLLAKNQFDTIYHEHYSYLSLDTVERIFARFGLRLWDVEVLSTHGGSLRVFGCHSDDPRPTTNAVAELRKREQEAGLKTLDTYHAFGERVSRVKDDFLRFLLDCRQKGLKVCGYGAAAKGNTLINYAGIRPDLVNYVCDAAPSKQGKFLPGSHIPILEPSTIRERRPDVVVVLPWNIFDEVVASLDYIGEWGGSFVVAIPTLSVIPAGRGG